MYDSTNTTDFSTNWFGGLNSLVRGQSHAKFELQVSTLFNDKVIISQLGHY
jgi:hypothetical protein